MTGQQVASATGPGQILGNPGSDMTSKKSSRKHSASGELFRMGVAAAVGAAAAYGIPSLWKLLPAQVISAVTGQVSMVADKVKEVKDSAVTGASRVAGQARQTASKATATSSGTAKRAASGSTGAARRTTSTARRTAKSGSGAKSGSNAKSGSGAKNGSGAKSRAQKPA